MVKTIWKNRWTVCNSVIAECSHRTFASNAYYKVMPFCKLVKVFI